MNSNNAVINNNCVKLHDLILIFKIPTGTRKNFIEIFTDNLGTRPQKGSPVLV